MGQREIVVVTGASAGIGRAVARLFARRGADVALLARGVDGLRAAAREVEACGGRALVVPTDVAEADAVETAAQRVEDEMGPVDVWVNNAMTTVFAPVWEVSPAEFRRATEVTLSGHRARHDGCPTPNARTRSQGDRAGRLGAVLPGHSPAVRLLRGEVRRTRLHRLGAHRARPRAQRVRITSVHLAGFNTPQFGWCLSRLPNHPQPVPPAYQPEVAAEGVWFAAHHRRREVWVGAPAVATILASRVAPGLLDRYLGRTGFDSQQTDEPASPGRPVNLWEPVPGGAGAHGIFGDRAHPRSAQLWATRHRRAVVMAAGSLMASGAAILGRRGIRA